MEQILNYTNTVKQYIIILCLAFFSMKGFANSESSNISTPRPQHKEFCTQEEFSNNWLEKRRADTFNVTCKAVSWFDGLFGDDEPFDDENFHGKITVGFKHGERDGFDPKVRIKIKSRLPNVSKRMNAFIGRVEEDSYISDSRRNQHSLVDSGINRDDNEEAEWLIGLGYQDPKKINRGFDYSVGAKISSGLNPYAKIRYKYLFDLPENHFARATQTLFWKNDDGYGTTTNLDYTYLLGDEDFLEWGISAKFTEDEDQWQWVTGTTWYHQLTSEQGISSRVYIRGEEENSESIPEYGVSVTYRRPFLREWLFMETGIEHRWVRETDEESRDKTFRFGIQFEMLFGEPNKQYSLRRHSSK